MNETIIDIEKVSNHWFETSNNDFNTMLTLFDSKSYAWALFIGHISIEKLLKGHYVQKIKTHAPFTHNLYRLAELCDIELTEERANDLDKITTFNLKARYDDYKKEFYAQCTDEFTFTWVERIKNLREWLLLISQK